MSTELAIRGPVGEDIERVLISGDLAKLTPEQRLNYYNSLCQSLGLSSLTQPFMYIVLNGKLQLYAKKDCTEQLRKIHGVSITKVDPKLIGDLIVVVADAADRDGRVDSSTAAVNSAGLKGENLANAMMKAETKAKRRVTLSICGLGMLDETEVQTLKEQGSASEPEGNKWPVQELHEPAGAPAKQQTAQPATQPPPPAQSQPQAQSGQLKFIPPNGLITVIRGVKEISAQTLVEYRAATETEPEILERKSKPYMVVNFLGRHNGVGFASCFDKKYWDLLEESIGLECHFQIREADKNGAHFINIVDVLAVDGQAYTEGVAK